MHSMSSAVRVDHSNCGTTHPYTESIYEHQIARHFVGISAAAPALASAPSSSPISFHALAQRPLDNKFRAPLSSFLIAVYLLPLSLPYLSLSTFPASLKLPRRSNPYLPIAIPHPVPSDPYPTRTFPASAIIKPLANSMA
ncbi:hypothetical protein PENSPDRAFT_273806 [Peniophora sp. CONT]|nr:hypothetical protein PENSPDRAFT_273806 [Peniophora sp. CONT]